MTIAEFLVAASKWDQFLLVLYLYLYQSEKRQTLITNFLRQHINEMREIVKRENTTNYRDITLPRITDVTNYLTVINNVMNYYVTDVTAKFMKEWDRNPPSTQSFLFTGSRASHLPPKEMVQHLIGPYAEPGNITVDGSDWPHLQSPFVKHTSCQKCEYYRNNQYYKDIFQIAEDIVEEEINAFRGDYRRHWTALIDKVSDVQFIVATKSCLQWDWACVMNLVVLKEEVLRALPERVHSIDDNASLTIQLVLATLDLKWSWSKLSRHLKITIDDIIQNPALPWNFKNLLMNPSITMKDINATPQFPWPSDKEERGYYFQFNKSAHYTEMTNKERDDSYFALRAIRSSSMTYEFFKSIDFKDWKRQAWESFSAYGLAIMETIENHPDEPWNYLHVSENQALTMEDVETHSEKPWHWPMLSMDLQEIDLAFLIRHQEKPFDWDWLSNRHMICLELAKQHLPEKPWNWSLLEFRDRLSKLKLPQY